MEENTITLSGTILEIEEPRFAPAGMPHQRFLLEHRSRQVEAGNPRIVQVKLLVEIRGELVRSAQRQVVVGQRVRVRGFLDRAGYSRSEYQDGTTGRTVLHAQMIETSP
ncbi:Primosomal replication protein n [gamma proteobacterium HdN1]|nr:Primosomal replication protein n [gamma proteobacterium HdN1]